MGFDAGPPTTRPGVFLATGRREKAAGVILGAPLDDTSSFRPGSRFAPQAVRAASHALEEYSVYCQRDLRDLPFFDAGDLVLPPGDTFASLATIADSVAFFLKRGQKPFLIGGEHTLSFGAVKGCLQVYPEITVIYIDAHADRRPAYQGVAYSHASAAYLLQQLAGVTLYQFGVRSADREEMPALQAGNVSFFSLAAPLERTLPSLKGRDLYITLDIDVVDPAFAPGVTAPEPGGITPGELIEIFTFLEGFKDRVIAFDLVEICPPYDQAQITALLGAKIMREALLTLL
ncbi:MAG: agmatinase [Firmicutes bacterium]|nr:agmatinase [Bacillota bacterium]